MRVERQTIQVRGSKPPTVEIDTQANSVYIRFKQAAVAKTVDRPADNLHIAIDLDSKGEVVGIEAVGVTEFGLQFILQKAAVSAPNVDVSKARYIPAELAGT